MNALRLGLSVLGVALFVAAALGLIFGFVSAGADSGGLAWRNALLGYLFFALVIVLALRQLIIWLARRQGASNG